MKNLVLKIIVALALAGLPRTATATVTFTLSPAVISNTYVGAITMQINGLTNGEPVMVDHFVDVNNNGVIDTNDFLFGHYFMVDGQRSVIGGVTNMNVPGDLTGSNGVITAVLNDYAPQPDLSIGAHLFRLTSPTGHFAAITNNFTITNWPYSQTISGVVKSGSTNLANADLVIDYSVSGGPAGGTVADGSGNYSFRAPPGSYSMIAIKKGYVVSGKLSVSLGTNTTVTTNLAMIPATRTLSGRVADFANTNLPLPGILVVLNSAGGLLTATATDTNGNFSAPVTSDIWSISLQEGSGLFALGYVDFQGGYHGPVYDTTTGSVSTAFVTVPKGTAMFYGTIKNNLNALMPGVKFRGDLQDTYLYADEGWSDTNGNYCAVTTTNNWQIQVSSDDPIFRSYVASTANNVTLSSNQAVRVDFLVEPMTGVVTGNVSSAAGPVAGLLMSGNTSVGDNYFQSSGYTDGNGNYFYAVFSGDWAVQANCSGGSDSLNALGYNCTSDEPVNVSTASTTVNFFVYPLGTAEMSAPVWAGPGQFGFTMNGTDGDNYYVQVSTNLTDWSTISNFNLSGSSIYIEDDNATNSPRFYRSVLSP
jgi:hypothetical protein